MLSTALIFVFLSFVLQARAQLGLPGVTPIWNSRFPLAMRSPYLNTVMPASNVPFNASNIDGTVRAPSQWAVTLASAVRRSSRELDPWTITDNYVGNRLGGTHPD